MKLLSILPIARGIRREMLTYFSAEDIKVGTVVTIPLRKKSVQGIIIKSEDAIEAKSMIKDMSFGIKKIKRHKSDTSLPEELIEATNKISEYVVTSRGAVLSSIVPKICLEHPEIFFANRSENKIKKDAFEALAIQASNSDRIDTIKSIIRESFAKKLSIAIICPTESSIKRALENLSKGISEYTLTLKDTSSKKHLVEWVEKAQNANHPMLLIGTGSMLALLPNHVGTVILEEESSEYYKSRREPYLDTRLVAYEISKANNARIIYADKLLSIETLSKIREAKIQEYSRISKRNTHKIQTLIANMNQKDDEKKVFKILSNDLLEMIKYSTKNGKKLFIYSLRRGLSPQTVCRDCGKTVTCDECESPVVLHNQSSEERRKFVCHHCGKSRSALESCSSCGSWNLLPLGIGIERIAEEIKSVTDVKIIRVDSDTVKNAKEAEIKIKEFLESDKDYPSILLGTELALRLLPDESVDFSAIASLESLKSMPDFRTSEKIMHILLNVKAKATECILVQTRDPDQKIIETGLSGDLESFVRDEIKARKAFGYPPYKHLVKLTVSGKKDRIKEDVLLVTERLANYNPRVFPAFIKSIKGQSLLHILIKVEEESWPERELSEILMSFPPSIKIDTSPQSLL